MSETTPKAPAGFATWLDYALNGERWYSRNFEVPTVDAHAVARAELAALREDVKLWRGLYGMVVQHVTDVAITLDVPEGMADDPPDMVRETVRRLCAQRAELASLRSRLSAAEAQNADLRKRLAAAMVSLAAARAGGHLEGA